MIFWLKAYENRVQERLLLLRPIFGYFECLSDAIASL